jgi:hypothetical protein
VSGGEQGRMYGQNASGEQEVGTLVLMNSMARIWEGLRVVQTCDSSDLIRHLETLGAGCYNNIRSGG